ncbi:MAG: diphthine synthase [bacterium]|nr:diphthine synthase [bacterium]
MTLYMIGIGLCDEKDISLSGLEAIKSCDMVYLDSYTSVLKDASQLETLYGKKVIRASRELIEQSTEIVDNAADKNIAFLVVGDALSATTHINLFMAAKQKNIKCIVINNASVISAVGITGLEIYKYGKTTSIPFQEENFKPEVFYDVLKENKAAGLHTLMLLDLRPNEERFMTIKEAIDILLDIEKKRGEKVFTQETLCIGCARLGSAEPKIKSGKAADLAQEDFGTAPFCLIVPGKTHFIEEEMIGSYS